MRNVRPDPHGSKSAAALLVESGLADATSTSEDLLKVNGAHDITTFQGLAVLRALTRAGDVDTALDFIRSYWGAMLDHGATTFWESFDLEWVKNAGRIDELTPEGKDDLHGDSGEHCYVGYRHSLCHGWSSGPTAWLSSTVLGVVPTEPGFAKVRIEPHLGNLEWAEGTYPTPKGVIRVRHERQPNGEVTSTISVPPGMVVEEE
jgi:hypothetical protein